MKTRMNTLLATGAVVLGLMVGGAAVAEHHKGHEGGKGGYMAAYKERVDAAVAKLPDDKAALVRQHLEANRAASKEMWQQKRALKEEMNALLVAPQFDKAAYLGKVRQMEELQSTKALQRANSVADVAEKLTQPERAMLVEAMYSGHGKKRGKYGHKDAAKPAATDAGAARQ